MVAKRPGASTASGSNTAGRRLPAGSNAAASRQELPHRRKISRGRGSLLGCSPRGCKDADTTKRLHSFNISLTIKTDPNINIIFKAEQGAVPIVNWDLALKSAHWVFPGNTPQAENGKTHLLHTYKICPTFCTFHRPRKQFWVPGSPVIYQVTEREQDTAFSRPFLWS